MVGDQRHCRLGANAGTEYVKTGASARRDYFHHTLIINLRHACCIAPLFPAACVKLHSLKNALCPMRSPTRCMPPPSKRWKEIKKEKYLVLWFGGMITFWAIWVLADFLGALVGASFPHIEKYGLDFAMVAAFIAIVWCRNLKARPAPSPGRGRRFRRAFSGPTPIRAGYRRRPQCLASSPACASTWRGKRAQMAKPYRYAGAQWRRWKMSNEALFYRPDAGHGRGDFSHPFLVYRPGRQDPDVSERVEGRERAALPCRSYCSASGRSSPPFRDPERDLCVWSST